VLLLSALIILATLAVHESFVPEQMLSQEHVNKLVRSHKATAVEKVSQHYFPNIFGSTTKVKDESSSGCDVPQTTQKVLNVVFYFNPLPVDHGGQIMETDWILNFLLGEICRPVRVIEKTDIRNDTLHVFLFNLPGELANTDALKAKNIVNQVIKVLF
jgi:hypothetical protein